MKQTANYGTATLDGKTYILDSVADFSGRAIPAPNETDVEFSARAHDEEGNKYWVYWIFSGEEVDAVKELDGLNWEKELDRVVAAD